ncbi:MAG: glutamate synthase-related protein [Chloroflexi bacterium]|nr:glutamate synthase-related protein [Chloroflexota bacterium]
MNDQRGWQNQRPLTGLQTQERERDACALVANIRKEGLATHGNLKRTIDALTKMGHRTGIVDGEGDGVGVMTDIPRQLWAKILTRAGIRASLAADSRFFVGHVMIPKAVDPEPIKNLISEKLVENGFDVLLEKDGLVNRRALGPQAEQDEPLFWQIAGLANHDMSVHEIDGHLFRAQMDLERQIDIHFASLSSHVVVYKMRGAVEALIRYYPELRNPEYCTAITIGHARYSTNTRSSFERVQPFSVLGHNGEFNTIARLRDEAGMLGVQLVPDGSDSQDIDRLLLSLCMQQGFDLAEGMEIIFPPIEDEINLMPEEAQSVYRHYRAAFGPFAQGPAALATRLGDLCVFSVDALGLRPLWFGETEKEYFFSSERGVVDVDTMVRDPKPLSPGEKMAVRVERGRDVYVHEYPAIRRHVVERARDRGRWMEDTHFTMSIWGSNDVQQWPYPRRPLEEAFSFPAGVSAVAVAEQPQVMTAVMPLSSRRLDIDLLAAMGWDRDDVTFAEVLATGREMLGSLGYDGQLAVLAERRVNLSDFFKETVSVVTNPSIDREREQEHFSTTVLLGHRPALTEAAKEHYRVITLDTPVLLGGHPELGTTEDLRTIAEKFGTMTLEDVISTFEPVFARISMGAYDLEAISDAVQRIADAAVQAVSSGAQCILLDDAEAIDGERLWIDPHLLISAVDNALKGSFNGTNFRRKTGVVVRSGAIRNLHDLALIVGMGADAVAPYAMFAVGSENYEKPQRGKSDPVDPLESQASLVKAATKGLEKIMCTIGCHELRGYGRVVSAIALPRELEPYFRTDNFCRDVRGWTRLEDDAQARAQVFRGEVHDRLAKTERMYPKVFKIGGKVARGELTIQDWMEHVDDIEDKLPVALRHLIGLKPAEQKLDPADVDITIGHHNLPVIIPAMSFGSQGETAFRAYAEAAYRLNIICMNGEGGELQDMMGLYRANRGQQVASARFGVNVELLNSADYIEIKIGQGAKPGEGGQLPGFKVTEVIAKTRHTPMGIPLISPSNNHDIYSIEDLAQIVEELKTVNPHAKISVKIPVVPGIGIIAVGVAKSGADIINLTGFEGGTGAARAHALQHVGLPAEIGVSLAHHALIQGGVRHRVELWCDGGMKSGKDVIRMVCLGANRVGFGTLAMVAIGCTICRSCETGTCHVGITSHLKSAAEALQYGQKHFEPREFDRAVEGIVTLFGALEQEIKIRCAEMGIRNLQECVGRTDLLEQAAGHDKVDISAMLEPAPPEQRLFGQEGVGRRVGRPRNFLTQLVTRTIMTAIEDGEPEVTYDDEFVRAHDRAMGTHLAGMIERRRATGLNGLHRVHLVFSSSALPGNGLAAFNDDPIKVMVEGGAQDGVAKSARGGKVMIMKGMNHDGVRVDGSVGKSFAYGAQGGILIVQGNADSRACIRLSGADVVFGGEVTTPLQDDLGYIGSRANLKGFACEYMTSGRVLVLGDPGPYFCAGMTGGIIYQRIQPDMNLTVEAIQRRLAKGSNVEIQSLEDRDCEEIRELMAMYQEALLESDQPDVASRLGYLTHRPPDHFVKIVPIRQ